MTYILKKQVLIPLLHGNGMRQVITKHYWSKFRAEQLEVTFPDGSYQCQICGEEFNDTQNLELHEHYSLVYDEQENLLTIQVIEVTFLCKLCHACHHIASADRFGFDTIGQLSKVNKITVEEAHEMPLEIVPDLFNKSGRKLNRFEYSFENLQPKIKYVCLIPNKNEKLAIAIEDRLIEKGVSWTKSLRDKILEKESKVNSVDQHMIKEVCTKFRNAIEKCKNDAGMPSWFSKFPRCCCGDTSHILMEYFSENGMGEAIMCSAWLGKQSHAWLDLDGWIIDITADQFGEEKIIVETKSAFHDGLNRLYKTPYSELSLSDDLKKAYSIVLKILE